MRISAIQQQQLKKTRLRDAKQKNTDGARRQDPTVWAMNTPYAEENCGLFVN